MSAAWIAIGGLFLATALMRASGPLALRDRPLPTWSVPVLSVLPGALLTALIVVQVFDQGGRVGVDAVLPGVLAAGGVLLWRRDGMLPAVLVAAAVTAALRAPS